jgi:tetratricopeptide (TPR) repeat protein
MELKIPERKAPSAFSSWESHKKTQVKEPELPKESKSIEEKKSITTKVFDIIMSVSFVALFFGLPLFFLNVTFQGIVFEKQLYFYFWVLVAIISWVTKSVMDGEIKIKETPLDYFIIAFTSAYLISTIFSVDRWHSFFGFFGDQSRGFMNLLACVLVYYFILSNFNKKRLVLSLGSIIASAIVVQIWTFIGLFFATKLPAWFLNHMPASLFGSMTSLGIFLSLVYPLFIITIYKLLESELSKKVRVTLAGIVGFFLVVNLVLIWFLYSFVFLPGIFPALVVGISFFVIFVIALIVRPKEGWSWVTIAAFMSVLILLMIGGGDGYLPQKLPAEVSPAYKLSWDVAKNTMKDKFFIGTGVASYGYDFSKYRPQELNNSQYFNLRFYQGAGLFFESLATIGFLGSVVLVVIVLSYLGTSIYLLSKEKEKNKLYSLGFISAGVTFLYSALTMRVDGGILMFGVLILIISLATLQLESSNEGNFKKLSLKASPKYALALAFIFMLVCGAVAYVFVSMGKALVADMYMKKASTVSAHTEDDSVRLMVKAANLYPNESRYYTRVGQEYMVLANNEALKDKESRNTSTIQQFLNNAILLSSKAKDLSPNDVLTVEGLAQVYENSTMFVPESSDLAMQYYNRALELEPHNPVYQVKLGEIQIAKAAAMTDATKKKEQIQEAIVFFQKSVDEKKDYAVGHYYISISNEALGELDKSIDSMKSAITSEPNNINYIFTLANLFRERGKGDDYTQAEQIYKSIITQDDTQYNVHLALGILFEKQKKNDAAIAEYKKVLTILPEGSDEAKTQVNKMISNVQNGTGNLQSAQAAPSQAQPVSPAQPIAQPVGAETPGNFPLTPTPSQP